MEHITEKSYAKINLYLDIVSKREDGYHNILTVMQNISLSDNVKIRKISGNDILIKTNISELNKNPQKNFAYKAAKAFFEELGVSFGVEIDIEKRIPMAAGMAGGSSNAASVLRGLNSMFDNPFSTEKLCEMGKKIGADVPFCIVGGTQIAEGIGEKLTDTQGIENCYTVASCGSNSAVSTPEAYKALDNKFDNFNNYKYGKGFSCLVDALKNSNLSNASKYMFNVFENTNSDTSVEFIKNTMLEQGALFSMMSGSGPSVFGIFNNKKDAENAASILKEKNFFAEVCVPLVDKLI